MKRFADEQTQVAGIPPVVELVVVEDAPVAIVPQIRDMPDVVVQRERAACSYQKPSGSPPFSALGGSGLNFIRGI